MCYRLGYRRVCLVLSTPSLNIQIHISILMQKTSQQGSLHSESLSTRYETQSTPMTWIAFTTGAYQLGIVPQFYLLPVTFHTAFFGMRDRCFKVRRRINETARLPLSIQPMRRRALQILAVQPDSES
jgi:hypothetical protein